MKKRLIGKITAFLCALSFTIFAGGCDFNSYFDEYDLSFLNETQPATFSEMAEPIDVSYSYNSITEEKVQNLYNQIAQMIEDGSPDTITCTGKLSVIEIHQALIAYINDHPQVFWLRTRFKYYTQNDITRVEFFFNREGDELANAQNEFNAVVDEIMQNAPLYGSEFERELYINDYLVENCEYDKEAAENPKVIADEGNAYGALVTGRAVCEGYSRAFQLLCTKMGIECVCIAGKVENTGHEWNAVLIEGNWYQTDVTWNDNGSEVSGYDYFNLTSERMYKDHIPDIFFSLITDEDTFDTTNQYGNFFIPECNSTEYNYFFEKYPVLSAIDEQFDEEISQELAKAMISGEKYFSIVVDYGVDYESAYTALIDEKYLVNYIEYANRMLRGTVQISTTTKVYKKIQTNVITFELNYE